MTAIHDGMKRDYPLLWEKANEFDFAERLGGCTDPLMREIDEAMRELFSARTFIADFTPDANTDSERGSMTELPRREIEFVLRDGEREIIISDIKGLVPSFVGYELTGEKDEHGRWILVRSTERQPK